jgi:hypothetical protein
MAPRRKRALLVALVGFALAIAVAFLTWRWSRY